MADIPERPIEKLLRAAAKKRRDQAGAPFELHPADRRLFQGEVARQYGRPQGTTESFGEVMARLWPRFAWGLGILAVLGVSVWVLVPLPGGGKREAMLAKNQAAFESAPTDEPVAQTPRMPARSQRADTESLTKDLRESPKAETWQAASKPAEDAKSLLADKNVRAPASRGVSPENFAAVVTPQLANEPKAAEMQLAGSAGTATQSPVGQANRALGVRYGVGGKADTSAGVPATIAPTASPALPMEVASVPAPEPTAMRPAAESSQPPPTYRSVAKLAATERPKSSSVTTDGLFVGAADRLEETKQFARAQRYVQVAPAAKLKAPATDKAAAAHSVLASFQVEQAGEELRIVDGDGSVYAGSLLLTDISQRARPVKAEPPAAVRAARAPMGGFEERASFGVEAGQPESRSYAFRVTGTNRSLNQPVVFTGNLLASTNLNRSLPAVTNLSRGGGVGQLLNAPGQPLLLPLVNSRISGKVVIGSGRAVEVNAVATKP